MKKLYTLTISILLIINVAAAQAPLVFKYQASIRDNNGIALLNKLVAIKISLLAGTANGASVYSEVHNVVTSDFGIVNLNIGNGTNTSGNFSTIDWGSNTYFIKTEVDINNGTNFLFMGTSQLLSVPYAMFAAKSGNAANDRDQDSTNEIQAINLNGNNLQLSKNGGSVDLTKYDKDSQQLVLSGNILSITKGNSIVLSGAVDLDADPTNEIQNLSLSKDTLKLSKANYIVLPKDNDADSTNEIQSLSVNQNKLTISKSNQVTIDADTTNEIQSLIVNQNRLSITKSNQVTIDADTTNEIQSLTYNNDILQLSKSNQVVFPKDNDRDSINEIQTLTFNNDSIKLTKANSVYLPSMPSGSIIAFGGRNIPNGWLLCSGDTVSRIVYNRLFIAIDSVWGNGNGITTFHLPDLRGQFLRGVSASSNVDTDTLLRTAKYSGGNTGNKVGSFQNDEFKSHNHNFSALGNSGNSLFSGYNGGNSSNNTTSNTGGSETRPKNAYVYYIIKY
jgi:microcystin-dependent protein